MINAFYSTDFEVHVHSRQLFDYFGHNAANELLVLMAVSLVGQCIIYKQDDQTHMVAF